CTKNRANITSLKVSIPTQPGKKHNSVFNPKLFLLIQAKTGKKLLFQHFTNTLQFLFWHFWLPLPVTTSESGTSKTRWSAKLFLQKNRWSANTHYPMARLWR